MILLACLRIGRAHFHSLEPVHTVRTHSHIYANGAVATAATQPRRELNHFYEVLELPSSIRLFHAGNRNQKRVCQATNHEPVVPLLCVCVCVCVHMRRIA